MAKYAAIIQTRTVDPGSILRRFAGTDVIHPTYNALSELCRVIKTIFLCRYLRQKSFRYEIHERLNVVENENSTNGFVDDGKSRKSPVTGLTSRECPPSIAPLLQASLVCEAPTILRRQPVYLFRFYQHCLKHASILTPLIYRHVNPYDRFDLNLNSPIDFGRLPA